MSGIDKLNAIRARCVELLDNAQKLNEALRVAKHASFAEAGWRATIAAIDGFLQYTGALTPQVEREYAWNMLQSILTAWEGLV